MAKLLGVSQTVFVNWLLGLEQREAVRADVDEAVRRKPNPSPNSSPDSNPNPDFSPNPSKQARGWLTRTLTLTQSLS